MAPRQLVRLKESRRPDSYDDQKTPAEIQQAELSAFSLEELVHYVLSQIRQITGEDNWFDPVALSLKELLESRHTYQALCTVDEQIGDCVYSVPDGAGIYQVRKCDPTDYLKLPATGVVLSKSDDTNCLIQFSGIVSGIYGGLTVGKLLFVSTDGGLTHTRPSPAPGGTMFVQPMGVAMGENDLLVNPSMLLTKLRG